jgi:hypothetical protein
VVNQVATINGLPIMDRLPDRIEHEFGMRFPADPPVHDVADVDIDHEREINEPISGRDIDEVRNPQHVRRQ